MTDLLALVSCLLLRRHGILKRFLVVLLLRVSCVVKLPCLFVREVETTIAAGCIIGEMRAFSSGLLLLFLSPPLQLDGKIKFDLI